MLHCELKPRMAVSESPPLLGRVPTTVLGARSVRLQETLNLPTLFRIAGTEVEHESDACRGHTK